LNGGLTCCADPDHDGLYQQARGRRGTSYRPPLSSIFGLVPVPSSHSITGPQIRPGGFTLAIRHNDLFTAKNFGSLSVSVRCRGETPWSNRTAPQESISKRPKPGFALQIKILNHVEWRSGSWSPRRRWMPSSGPGSRKQQYVADVWDWRGCQSATAAWSNGWPGGFTSSTASSLPVDVLKPRGLALTRLPIIPPGDT